MCIACNSPVAIVWHDYDKTDKQAIRAEVTHREKLLKAAMNVDSKVPFQGAFYREAMRLYQECIDDYNRLIMPGGPRGQGQ